MPAKTGEATQVHGRGASTQTRRQEDQTGMSEKELEKYASKKKN